MLFLVVYFCIFEFRFWLDLVFLLVISYDSEVINVSIEGYDFYDVEVFSKVIDVFMRFKLIKVIDFWEFGLFSCVWKLFVLWYDLDDSFIWFFFVLDESREVIGVVWILDSDILL